ncbi:putative aldehyde dehydrogenase YcbD [Marinithermofilum abyssi]|uniref:Putative aldehyde dehydrogenase YcbD n=1 Tax=Marinithermofilum abyssi TaxID=1571185 RepID=A0A8J2YBZ7_9BACL|nr:alpha-ketoglutaric semialdehyde dehydrogenase GucD [Marinithermofilum abyssi]GGE29413.1 putative aldehyde dehydrogenase YcbD [Marinithermofilum abyssi]
MSVQTKTVTCHNFIDGSWTPSKTERVEASINPANTNEIVGYVQNSDARDVDQAVKAAVAAQRAWRKRSGVERGQILYRVADVLEKRAEEIAETMTREMGKTLPEARGETARGVAILRYYAGEGSRKIGDVIPASESGALMFTTRVPLGVVGVITPWNFPVAIPIWKAAPALVYGNTVVMKPAQETAVTAAKVIQCFEEGGIPSGVINLVNGGAEVGQSLVNHPDVDGITFTGSNDTGRKVGQLALARGAKYQLEMGGKNPVIVAADADLDEAVEAVISGGLKTTGQKCTATSRVFIQREVYNPFREKLLDKVKRLQIGSGLDPQAWMGPVVSEKQLEKVLWYIEEGKREGAVLLCGGERIQDEGRKHGYFIQPTVFEHVTPAMRIAQEEIFGPVLALMPFDRLNEALEMANDVEFGLSASIFTKDIGKMLSFIEEIDAGMIRINAESAGVELQAPFGGMKKSSSHSREQGQAALEFFTSIKTVFVRA